MDILGKLPLLASSGAVASSIALPIVLSKENTQTVKQQEVQVVTKPLPKKRDPGHTVKRWEEANKYFTCVENGQKTREQCRSEHWFWDL